MLKSMEKEFIEIINSIPEEIRKIQGVFELNPIVLADKYFKAGVVADASIDANANVGGKAPVNFQSEIFKPQLKLRSFYELWKRLKVKYGSTEAKDILVALMNGTLYFHDVTKIDCPYCFAFDTSNIMFYGRPYGWLPGAPPTRSSSFIGQLVECTMDFSQENAGAIGLANVFINLAYYTHQEREALLKTLGDPKDCRNLDILTNQIMTYIAGLGYSEKIDRNNIRKQLSHFTAEEVASKCYDKYVENLIQQFVHVMHNTFRVGGDSPFTNISIFDRHIINSMFKDAVYPDGTCPVDNMKEIMHLQEVFVEFFVKGSPLTGKNYRFPVATVNIKKWTELDYTEGRCDRSQVGHIADTQFFEYIMEKNLDRGTFNIHIGEKVASCCRLTNDLAELKQTVQTDSFGNGGISIGSHRVVALNLHRFALIYREMKLTDPEKNAHLDFLEILHKYMEYARKVLVIHKELLKERVDAKFLKFFNIGWCDLNMFFSTFGYTGLWDCYKVLAQCDPSEDLERYNAVAYEILSAMDKFATDAGHNKNKKDSTLQFAFNVEEIPAENASPKLASMDNYYYNDTDWYEKTELLANQMIPLYENVALFDRLQVTGNLMDVVSGGSILHLNLSEKTTLASYIDLNKLIIENYNISHYAINVGTTTCVNGHTTLGIHQKCPTCDGDIKTHTIRVVGFNTDTTDWIKQRREGEWNKGKGRQFYTASNILK